LGSIKRDDEDMNRAPTIWLPLLVLVAALVFWGYCLLDFTQTDEREIRTFSKSIWLVILVFGSVLGGLLWLSVGRPQHPERR
jgi:hypothetical protein